MAFEFKLPELGENIEQADIVKVMVSVGDKVEVDQILLEIETDKATVEVPSEFSGIVKSVNVKDGDTVKVGDVIFTFEDAGESESKGKEEVVEENEKKEENIIDQPVKQEAKKVEKQEKSEEKTETSGGILNLNFLNLVKILNLLILQKFLFQLGIKLKLIRLLFEIETDKATVEVPSEFSGIIKEVKVKDGDTAKVGDVVLVVETKSGQTTKKAETKKEEPIKQETRKSEEIKESKKEKVEETKESIESEKGKSSSYRKTNIPFKNSTGSANC